MRLLAIALLMRVIKLSNRSDYVYEDELALNQISLSTRALDTRQLHNTTIKVATQY